MEKKLERMVAAEIRCGWILQEVFKSSPLHRDKDA